MDFQFHVEKYRITITWNKAHKREHALTSQRLTNIEQDVSLEIGVDAIVKSLC